MTVPRDIRARLKRLKEANARGEYRLPQLTRSTAADHEIEAARDGQAAECCGSGNERR